VTRNPQVWVGGLRGRRLIHNDFPGESETQVSSRFLICIDARRPRLDKTVSFRDSRGRHRTGVPSLLPQRPCTAHWHTRDGSSFPPPCCRVRGPPCAASHLFAPSDALILSTVTWPDGCRHKMRNRTPPTSGATPRRLPARHHAGSIIGVAHASKPSDKRELALRRGIPHLSDVATTHATVHRARLQPLVASQEGCPVFLSPRLM
jgi:hypothetical protein